MHAKTITKESTFSSKRNIASIAEYKKCLEKFSANFSDEVSLKTQSPIFLDTNILLRYYSISFTARKKLLEFIKTHSKRIIITSQVQFEFLKNREDIIQRFFEQVTTKIPKDFNSEIVNKMKSFLDQHKVVLKDYPFVETGIAKYQGELETLLQKLNDTVEEKRKEHSDLILKDELIDLLITCNLYDGLTSQELEIIKTDFDALSKGITSENSDSFFNKPNSVFPGLGDIKNKPDDPYGDYIIFHEMMKYMMTHDSDVIFLTFDNTKGDWMTKSKLPHIHYLLNTHANTSQLIYIVDAERTLGELLNINIASLVSDAIAESITPITIERLDELSYKMFPKFEKVDFSNRAMEELKLSYNTMEEIERDVVRGFEAVLEYKRIYVPTLNTLGALKTALRIVNSTMTHFISLNGKLKPIGPITLERYKALRPLIK